MIRVDVRELLHFTCASVKFRVVLDLFLKICCFFRAYNKIDQKMEKKWSISKYFKSIYIDLNKWNLSPRWRQQRLNMQYLLVFCTTVIVVFGCIYKHNSYDKYFIKTTIYFIHCKFIVSQCIKYIFLCILNSPIWFYMNDLPLFCFIFQLFIWPLCITSFLFIYLLIYFDYFHSLAE